MIQNRSSIYANDKLLGIGIAISLLGDATLYTVLPHPDISTQLGITLSMVGLLLGANRATRLVLNSPVGILYDRMPRRGLLIGLTQDTFE
jgi:MFS family permease